MIMNFSEAVRVISQSLPGIVRHGPYRGVYPDYESSQKDCEGYEDNDLVTVVLEKTENYKNNLFNGPSYPLQTRQTIQNLFILSYIYKNLPLNVVDFGGACGATYFEAKYYLPEYLNRWSVVETIQMSGAGKKNFQEDQLRFYSDISDIDDAPGNKDLIIASAVIQYTRDPLRTLEILLSNDYEYVYLTRTPLSSDKDGMVISRQISTLSANGPGPFPPGFTDKQLAYPVTFIPVKVFNSKILELNYKIIYNFDESPPTTHNLGNERITLTQYGCLLKKRV